MHLCKVRAYDLVREGHNRHESKKTPTLLKPLSQRSLRQLVRLKLELHELIESKDWTKIECFLTMKKAETLAKEIAENGSPILSLIVERQPPISIVRRLTVLHPQALATKDHLGQLPLHRACAAGASNDVVLHLIKENLDAVITTDQNDRLPIHYSVERACAERKESGTNDSAMNSKTNCSATPIFEALLQVAPQSVYTTDLLRRETPIDIALRLEYINGRRNRHATAAKEALRSVVRGSMFSRSGKARSTRRLKTTYRKNCETFSTSHGRAA